jgi:cyclopropane-fatty-acyl-phospholipid synthase
MIANKLNTLPWPDFAIRFGIRRLLQHRLQELYEGGCEAQAERKMWLMNSLDCAPLAESTSAANTQHYELPTAFFEAVLGPALKYSSCLWEPDTESLAAAENLMLDQVAQRAQLDDGQRILDMGCGWGSFSLYAAARYPNSRILAVSNSRSQRLHLQQQLKERGLDNVEILTGDINSLDIPGQFDRIVSIEMFEHMRNYRRLSSKLAPLLADDGRLFVHVFTHREHPYVFTPKHADDWMARYFFTGGTMPSADLLPRCFDDFRCERQWAVNGTHYAKTAEAWLENMDATAGSLHLLVHETYGAEAKRWWVYWRVFFMSCAELFGYDDGNEWFVSHYLFRKPKS